VNAKMKKARLGAPEGDEEKQKCKERASSQQLRNAWEIRTREVPQPRERDDQRQKIEKLSRRG